MQISQLYKKTLSDTLETFDMCISEFYLPAKMTKYIATQIYFFFYFLHTCERLEWKFLLWFWHADFLRKHFYMKIDI